MKHNEQVDDELEYEDYDEYEDDEEYEESGPSGLSLALNNYFHHLDRGGSLGGEIAAGLAMFFLSICVIFMNMQLVGNVINAGVALGNTPADPVNIAAANVYTQLYAGAILVSIFGSLLMGLVAKLPFVQVSFMGLASGLLCLVSAGSGLTWQNLLFMNLLAGILYTAVCAVGPVRQWLLKAMPDSVRRALPAALGLMVAWCALQMTGLVTTTRLALGSSQGIVLPTGFALSDMRALTKFSLIGCLAAIVFYILAGLLKRKHRILWSLLGGTVCFAGITLLSKGIDPSNIESYINFGRIWLIAGSQASPVTPFGDSYLTYAGDAIGAVFANMGQVFSKGMDFSAYSGSGLLLVIGGALSYVFAGLFGTQAAVTAAAVEDTDEEKALLCNAITNLAAPLLGAAAVSPGVSSVAGSQDNGKSGLSSIVACLGFAISLFVMAIPALFATVTYPVYGMNEWNYFAYGNGGLVYLIQGATFAIVDCVLLCVGVSMAKGLRTLDWKDISQWLPTLITVLLALLTSNLVLAAAFGCLAALIAEAIGTKKCPAKESVILCLVLLIAVFLA